ncbi:MAG: urease accessory protein UreD [Rhizobiales bacterium]|nr:urease accessory protein UreD [Hyphomicrobiales bacterium]
MPPRYQRSLGKAVLKLSARGVETLREEGAAKIRLPATLPGRPVEAIVINTSGGVTGGDDFAYDLVSRAGVSLTATTQAAEKVYRAEGAPAHVAVSLAAEAASRLAWLPQETILFDGAALNRTITGDIAADSSLLIVEAIVFGRTEMGERDIAPRFHDRWRIRRDGRLVYADDFRVENAIPDCPAGLDGARAFATILLIAPNAEKHLKEMRDALGDRAGVSTWHGKLVARLLAPDGFNLRKRLIPAVRRLLPEGEVPRIWSL